MGLLRNIRLTLGKIGQTIRLNLGGSTTVDFKIPEHIMNEAKLIVYKKHAKEAEDILRRHIESDIEGVTRPGGGHWYPDGSPYVKRNVLSGSVQSKVSVEGIRVSATAPSAPSVIHGGSMSGGGFGGWGAYLEFHEEGNIGFLGYFSRPAVSNAQAECEATLLPIIKKEIKELATEMWLSGGV